MVGQAPATYTFGPGTIQIGEVGSEIDFEAQLTGGTVEWDKEKEDDVNVLSGGTLAGDVTYSATISGNVFQDLGAVDSLVEWTWTHKGEQVPITFVPSTAAAKSIVGEITVDPISVGGDEVKRKPRSDFEWDFVGEPTIAAVVPLMGPAPLASIGEEPAPDVDDVATPDPTLQ